MLSSCGILLTLGMAGCQLHEPDTTFVRDVLRTATRAASAWSNQTERDDLLSEIALFQAELQDVDCAIATVELLEDLDERGRTLVSLIDPLLSHHICESRRIAAAIKPEYDLNVSYRPMAYAQIGEALARQGNLTDAREIAKAISLTWGTSAAYGVVWEVATYEWISGNEGAALHTLKAITADPEDRIRLMVSAAVREYERGNNVGAYSFLTSATNATEPTEVTARTSREIAIAFASMNDFVGARSAIAKLADENEREAFLEWLAIKQLQHHFVNVGELLREITSDERIDRIRYRVAISRVEHCDLFGAQDALGMIRSNEFRALASAKIGQLQWMVGCCRESIISFDNAHRFAEQVALSEDGARQGDLFVELGVALGKCGRSSESRRAFQRAIQIALKKRESIDTSVWSTKSHWYSTIRNTPFLRAIAGQLEVGDIHGALHSHSLIDRNSPSQDGGLSMVAMALFQRREFERAITIAEKIESLPLRGFVFRQIAESWVLMGGTKRAFAWANAQCNPIVKSNALLGIAQGTVKLQKSRRSQ